MSNGEPKGWGWYIPGTGNICYVFIAANRAVKPTESPSAFKYHHVLGILNNVNDKILLPLLPALPWSTTRGEGVPRCSLV